MSDKAIAVSEDTYFEMPSGAASRPITAAWQPTNNLKFVKVFKRPEQWVELRQEWRDGLSGKSEWRIVPTEVEML